MEYRELVKEIRRQLGISQEDLAREVGISYATVNRWENGQVRPSKLAKAHFIAFCERIESEGKISLPQKLAQLVSNRKEKQGP